MLVTGSLAESAGRRPRTLVLGDSQPALADAAVEARSTSKNSSSRNASLTEDRARGAFLQRPALLDRNGDATAPRLGEDVPRQCGRLMRVAATSRERVF